MLLKKLKCNAKDLKDTKKIIITHYMRVMLIQLLDNR